MAITKIEVPELFDFGSDNSAFKLPTGTTADRPTSPSNGEMRFNTTTGYVEYYDTTNNAGSWNLGKAGGSGVVILRYPSAYTATYTAGTGGAADAESTVGSDNFIRITAGTGTITFS